MEGKTISFIYENCAACGICTQTCPISAISLTKTDVDNYKKAYPELTERPCTGCAICEKACPMQAIEIRSVT